MCIVYTHKTSTRIAQLPYCLFANLASDDFTQTLRSVKDCKSKTCLFRSLYNKATLSIEATCPSPNESTPFTFNVSKEASSILKPLPPAHCGCITLYMYCNITCRCSYLLHDYRHNGNKYKQLYL